MKKIAILAFVATLSIYAKSKQQQEIKSRIVDVSCGECQFGMDGKKCDLAVRIDGRTYFVDGTTIDEHGDPHAKDGFCKAVRKAQITGVIVDNRCKVTAFQLLP